MENDYDFSQNITDIFYIDDEYELYVTPWWRLYMWFSLMWLITFIGGVGNVVVIWIVLVHKNMRTITNIFLVNLAIADGLVATSNIPFVAHQIVYAYWPLGHIACKMNVFIAVNSICVSVLTLSMIALDRYRAIMYPFKLRMGLGQTITIIVLMWIISIIITTPDWLYMTTYHNNSTNTLACSQLWPEDFPQTLYRAFFMFFTYFLPLTCMTFSYGRLGRVLWGSKSIGEKSENQLKKDLAKQKIVKMMIVVVVIFTICWLPFHIYFIIHAAGLFEYAPNYIYEVNMAVFWFAMSNSMYNPIIYCWMNARFRAGFKKAFRWCPYVKYDSALDEIYFKASGAGRKSVVTEVE